MYLIGYSSKTNGAMNATAYFEQGALIQYNIKLRSTKRSIDL
jgi:hypothetical protein